MLNKWRRQAGMTLVELIVAIVIIAVGLAGVLSVFNTTVKNSADPMIRKQLLALAEGMMDEVMLLPFVNGPETGTGCAGRPEFDGVDDFANYNDEPICDYDGTTKLPGYSVTVAVAPVLWQGVPLADARQITVTAKRGSIELVLVGWRTKWAQP